MQLVNGEHYVLNNDTRVIFPISHEEDIISELHYMLGKQKVSIVRINADHQQGFEILSADKYDEVFKAIRDKAKVAIEKNRVKVSIKDSIIMKPSDSKPAPAQKVAA